MRAAQTKLLVEILIFNYRPGDKDEFDDLAEDFNKMAVFKRIQEEINRQEERCRQFMADVRNADAFNNY